MEDKVKGKGLKDNLVNLFINIIVISILAIALSIAYLNIDEIKATFIGGYNYVVINIIKVAIVLIFISLVILNIKNILKGILFLSIKLLDFAKRKIKPNKHMLRGNNRNGNLKIIEEGRSEGYPPLNLLKEVKSNNDDSNVLRKMLLQTFNKYDLDVKVKRTYPGPTITRFLLDIGDSKISKITKYENEIAMTMGVESVTIKPTPSGLAMEVPNIKRKIVGHKEIMEKFLYRNKKKNSLDVPIGKMAVGNLQNLNIAESPHILIAGQTGSGKSVCINTILTSLLLTNKPEDLKLILIDPKVVELSIYNGIPHLLLPVVTDAEKSATALNWAVLEMEKRYKLFAKNGVRDIDKYNKKPNLPKIPKIVIVIDELADLMLIAKDEVEEGIQRLGQLARAAGIHLIVATQRPSKEVVTGLIKANIPTKIAFSVNSGINSRIILDENGAEKLLGKGDGILSTTEMQRAVRFQGSYISDYEVERVITWWKRNGKNSDMGLNLEEHQELEKNDSIEKNKEKVNKSNYSQSEFKVRKYINEIAYYNGQEEVILPSTNTLREEIGIRKKDLLETLNLLEEEEKIKKEGKGRGAKIHLLISEEEAYKFLDKYCPGSLKE